MKTVYIAHPIAGDIDLNIFKVQVLMKTILRTHPEIVPVAPYLVSLQLLDESRPGDREIGLRQNKPYFMRKFIDELWICGHQSPGVRLEMEWATAAGIPAIDKTEWAAEILGEKPEEQC